LHPSWPEGHAQPLKRARRQSGQQDMEAIFTERLQWIEDVMTTEDRL